MKIFRNFTLDFSLICEIIGQSKKYLSAVVSDFTSFGGEATILRLGHSMVGAFLHTYTLRPLLSQQTDKRKLYKIRVERTGFDSSETNDSAIVNSVINVKNHKSRPHTDSLSWMKAMRLINSFTLLKVEGISYQIR